MPPVIQWNSFKNFDWEIYRLNYPEFIGLLQTQHDALFHYAHVGRLENRTDQVPSIFDWERYANTYKHLSLNTPRESYLHFACLGLKYKKEKTTSPLGMLLLSQYEKIMEHNRSMVRPVNKDFRLPPLPKNMTSPPQYRQTNAPNLLNPPKEPLQKPRPTDPVAGQLQPKIAAVAPLPRQNIKTTPNSILQPTPNLKPTPQPRPAVWPPRPTEEKRPPQAPTIFHPHHKPSRTGIIHTNTQKGPTLYHLPPPPPQTTEKQRLSQPPVQLKPLPKPSRSGIIQPKPIPEEPPIRPYIPPHIPYRPHTPYKRSSTPYKSRTQPPKEKTVVPVFKPIMIRHPPKKISYTVRQPQENELVLKVPPSQYFKKN